MLYLKSLTIDKFKSFKHAEIVVSKGFTCVVGPNGSGKSNICDALLFGLGENSMNRLRVNKLDELIDFSIKRKHSDVAKAHVRLELAGDQDYVIVRTVRSDGKTQYSVNGKHMTRQEVLEILNVNRIRADETSTITQGEINRIISLSPKERRELIDIASGIKEFEAKKADALRELEKVSQRILETQGMLNEKVSFLRELEKEKESAERFIEYTAKLKSLRYSILATRKEMLKTALDGFTKDLAVADSKRNETEFRRSEIAKKLNDYEAERESLTHNIGASSAAMNDVNSRYDAINKEMATLEAEINSHKSALIDIGTFTDGAEKEIERIKETLETGSRLVIEHQQKLKVLEKDTGAAATMEEANSKEKEIDNLNKAIHNLEKQVSESQAALVKLDSESASLVTIIEELSKSVESSKLIIKEKEGAAEKIRKDMESLRETVQKSSEAAKKNESERSRIEKEIEALDETLIDLKEQKSYISSKSNNMAEKLAVHFKESDGFFGSASSLCSYDTQYSLAVETAAGSRLDYFVTDTIANADKMIAFLKKNELGRATFIPIKEIRSDDGNASEKGLDSVISVVKYEKKFDKVFKYIFNNSFIVSGPEEAKKYGIGKHRYVTRDGELIELSGTVSGGFSKRRVSLASIENQIKEATSSRARLHEDRAKAEETAFEERKAQAAAEMKLDSESREQSRLESEAASTRKALASAASRMEESKRRLSAIQEKKLSESKVHDSSEEALSKAKERLMQLYNEAVEATKEMSKHGAGKAEREKQEKSRKEAEDIRIKVAETKKEAQILESRKLDLERQVEEKRKLAKNLDTSINEKTKKIEALEKERKEMESKIKNSGELSKKAMERLSKINEEVEKLREDNGRVNMQLNEVDRELGDIKVKRSQTETRLSDITAELAAYGNGIPLVKGDIDIMQRETDVLESKLQDLGTVNMRAPELYDDKKKSVDEALTKSNTLEIEKQAVIRMIEEIDSKKLQVFMSTFNDVNKNFSKLYNYIFPGKAYIELENPGDPFNGGIEIKITDANLNKALKSMSGGQKSLILLMMLFSIHLCKPSSLYVFDEVDSALDKENSKKLSQLIKEMSKEAQFVVVSHNDSLIINSDTAVGVVMANGESKALGLEVSSIPKK